MKLTNSDTDIALGFTPLSTWNSEKPLYPEWMSNDHKLKKEVEVCSEKDRVIWYGEELEVTINYPISKPYVFKIRGAMSRRQLVDVIAKHFKKIYDNPEAWGCLFPFDKVNLHTLHVYNDGTAEVGIGCIATEIED